MIGKALLIFIWKIVLYWVFVNLPMKFLFIVEAVLTENHPLYTPPESDEQYCYKKGKIVFQGLKCVKWINRNEAPFTDAFGEEDYGNIDVFELSNDKYVSVM